jgi:hypothetical protein
VVAKLENKVKARDGRAGLNTRPGDLSGGLTVVVVPITLTLSNIGWPTDRLHATKGKEERKGTML